MTLTETATATDTKVRNICGPAGELYQETRCWQPATGQRPQTVTYTLVALSPAVKPAPDMRYQMQITSGRSKTVCNTMPAWWLETPKNANRYPQPVNRVMLLPTLGDGRVCLQQSDERGGSRRYGGTGGYSLYRRQAQPGQTPQACLRALVWEILGFNAAEDCREISRWYDATEGCFFYLFMLTDYDRMEQARMPMDLAALWLDDLEKAWSGGHLSDLLVELFFGRDSRLMVQPPRRPLACAEQS